ncbi:serine/threonine protein kinase [Methylomonas sp. AM2-LC]|uniref:serine/threonine protein kinase n=1 Tax=Methylomonas sp. AM2-LC TaxID=3153301 RepID=UPI003263818F
MIASDDDYTLIKPRPEDDKTVLRSRHYPTPVTENAADSEQFEKFSGDYSLRGAVGEGGVGRVLLGFDERIGREVAIKEMLDQAAHQDESLSSRFLREARITGRLEHPGIVPVYDLGTKESGAPYYVMRLVRGDTLAKKLNACNQCPAPEQALAQRLGLLDRLIDVCEAIAYAHSKGIIHRDIKPGNIVLGPFGETIVLDWGLAKVENEADNLTPQQPSQQDNPELTCIGDILGTPAYMAPEQADPSFGQVDARSDVFALGCMLYYLLVGHPPLRGSTDDILAQLSSTQPMPLTRHPKLALPPELTAICDKALQKNPSLRFANAALLAEELCAYRDGRLVNTYAYSPAELLRRFIARNRIALLAALAVLIAILIGAGLAFKFGVEAQQARQLAETESENVKREKHKVETALAEVTRISNTNLTAADHIASLIRQRLATLQQGQTQLAASLHNVNPGPKLTKALAVLLEQSAGVESIAASQAPGRIMAVVPDKYRHAIGADTSQLEHNILTLQTGQPVLSRVYMAPEGFAAVTLVVPVKQGQQVTGFIAARIQAAEFLGGLLAEDQHTAQRDIWVVQDDGLILYDNNPDEIGRNLFREDRYLQIPELRQLSQQIAKQEAGVGYYENQSAAEAETSHRIASWETLRPTENRAWKVVVLEAW